MKNGVEPTGANLPGRLAGLDVIRLAAVVLVLGRHYPGMMPQVPGLWRLTMGGWVGVDLFFVLSGFLVSGLLFSEYHRAGTMAIGRFYARRAWKIYPAFAVLIVVSGISDVLGGRLEGARFWAESLFVQNYAPGRWNHAWSLAVEEHFYLLLPMFLTYLTSRSNRGRDPFRVIPLAACVVGVVELLARIVTWWRFPIYSHYGNLFPTHLRLDSLFLGVALAYAYHFGRAAFVSRLRPYRHALAGGGALCLSPAFIFPLDGSSPFIFTAGLSVIALASAAIVSGILLSEWPTHRVFVPFAKGGAASYSIYLWHLPVFEVLSRALARGEPIDPWASLSVYLLSAVGFGIVAARLIEIPCLRLRDRLIPRQFGASPA
jgi:peptidoglycan/LPS O-acetylase OafA/YrhL